MAGSSAEISVLSTPMTLPGAGDLRLPLRVAFGTFRGEYDEVWVRAPAFQDFLSELRAPGGEAAGLGRTGVDVPR